MSFIERIINIIRIKSWSRAKRKEQEIQIISKKKEDTSRSSSDYSGNSQSVVGFFVGAMIAVVIALQITWPVTDSAINTNMGNNATWQVSESVNTMLNLVPLVMVMGVIMIFLRPLLD